MTKFKHQSVRDLAWVIRSSPLVENTSHYCVWPESQWYQRIYEDALPWLILIDADPSELNELLAEQKDRRLGKHFETLWHFWLRHCSHYEVVENNVQIIIDGETLGEIDFILFDKILKKTVHWEMAVKFYLGADDTCKMHNWHGPNLRDRLDIKVDHLLHRQSVISKDSRVQRWLRQQGIHIDECAVILKGRLYFPWSLLQPGKTMSTMLPLQCAKKLSYGYWLKQSEFDEVFDDKARFEPLIKKGWLGKMLIENAGQACYKENILHALSKKKMRLPLQLQVYNSCYKRDRFFLVDESWPLKKT